MQLKLVEKDNHPTKPNLGHSLRPPLDQYYTKKNIAEICFAEIIKIINEAKQSIRLKDYIFFEPSAGYGVFCEMVKSKGYDIVGYDIAPKHEYVGELDFLNTKLVINEIALLKKSLGNKKIITIGNPPFGKRSGLAIKFFNQASLFSNLICFIVPNQFKKWTVHKELNPIYKLIHEIDLPPRSFFTEEKKDYHVNSIFQIWTSLESDYPDKRIRFRPATSHSDFTMYQYNNTKDAIKVFKNDFDFAIFSQGYGDYKTFITNRNDFDLKKQYILFKCKSKKVIANLKKIDYEKLSRENTTTPGFRKNNVVTEYVRKYGL